MQDTPARPGLSSPSPEEREIAKEETGRWKIVVEEKPRLESSQKALTAHASALTYVCCFESCAPSVRNNSRTPSPHPRFSTISHPAHQLPEG